MSISAQLSQFIIQCQYTDIPITVRQRARLHLLDSLGVALAGSCQNTACQARNGISGLPDHAGHVAVWGTRQRFSPALAALANGIANHVLDYDDTHTGSIVHGSAVLTAVALALAQSLHQRSDEMLTGWIIGWEVAARIGMAAHGSFHQRGFHSTAIAGVFAATACAARLLQLNEQQTCYALGLAGSQAAGVAEYLSNGSASKAFHAGWSAQSGMLAATLAKGGMTGPCSIFEGRYGLYTTHGNTETVDYGVLTGGLASQWQIMNVSIKPYPVCHFAHATIDCARMLRQQGIDAGQIQQIECVVDPVAAALICEPLDEKFAPQTSYAAKFSLPWLVAAGFFQDSITLKTLATENLTRPDWLGLARKVTYRYPQAGDLDFPRYFPGLIYVTLNDGRTLCKSLTINYGNPQNPMTIADINKKFMDNAQDILSVQQAGAILALLSQDDSFSVETLSQLLQLPD